MTRLHIARQYAVDDWFLPAVRDIIARDEPLTGDEIGRLGLDFAVKVIALREEARGPLTVPRQVLVGTFFFGLRVIAILLTAVCMCICN